MPLPNATMPFGVCPFVRKKDWWTSLVENTSQKSVRLEGVPCGNILETLPSCPVCRKTCQFFLHGGRERLPSPNLAKQTKRATVAKKRSSRSVEHEASDSLMNAKALPRLVAEKKVIDYPKDTMPAQKRPWKTQRFGVAKLLKKGSIAESHNASLFKSWSKSEVNHASAMPSHPAACSVTA
jgi:hypothetical protein